MSASGARILVDGRAVDVVPADDRGLLYGDHVFETIAFHDRRAPLWERHWQRLSEGCRVLGLPLPEIEPVWTDCVRLAVAAASCIVRLTLTRGSGGRAYFPPEDVKSRRIAMVRPWPAEIERQRRSGLSATISSIRLPSSPLLGGLKHGNRLEQVIAARECAGSGSDEALLFDQEGGLVEGLMSNLILETDDGLVTPETASGVRGVGLGWLRDHPAFDIASRRLDRDSVEAARAVLMVNSVAGVRPVVRLDERRLPITPMCRRLQELWNEELT
ncbi:MAG: aminodeoxychorismate lyase [Wenzhouxiangella sp.]|jgi:4-amino-4-deoxychorismate lyase|nr:aminodeoxychorismate lyase [Wenzhouxiangella sp.]